MRNKYDTKNIINRREINYKNNKILKIITLVMSYVYYYDQ